MTLLTCIEIEGNYPDNILINAGCDEESKKWAAFMYMINNDGSIHKLMLSTQPTFHTEEDAKSAMKEIAEWAIEYVKNPKHKF